MNTRAHVFIEGFVQGVFYRTWTQERAEKLGLTGWVRNLTDGRVEAVIEGKENQVNQLVELIKKGPPVSEVKHVDVIWEKAADEFQIFDVRSTV